MLSYSTDKKPQVDEDVKVKQMNRLQQLRSRCSYNTITKDESGWVSKPQARKKKEPRE